MISEVTEVNEPKEILSNAGKSLSWATLATARLGSESSARLVRPDRVTFPMLYRSKPPLIAMCSESMDTFVRFGKSMRDIE